jgi:toxin ParE1/3/4
VSPVVRKLPAAEDDLFDIWTYVAADSVTRADELIRRIDRTLRLLAENPRAGKARPELAPELRSFPPVESYVVYYRPLPRRNGIEIVRVLHASQDVGGVFVS